MTVPALGVPGVARRRRQRSRQTFDLVAHLVRREFQLRYRRALFGWLWAIGQPLARFFVLLFVFTRILPVDVPNYPAFLFVGLVTWIWFSSGVLSSTNSVLARRDLLFRPGLTRMAAPTVSVLTDALDFLAALPIIAVFLALNGGIPITALALPALMVLQLLLILGVGMALCSANVYLRDVSLIVEVGLLLGFYVTPVFYRGDAVPERLQWVLDLNPMARLLDAYRTVLVEGGLPTGGETAVLVAMCVGFFAIGVAIYGRASSSFADEL